MVLVHNIFFFTGCTQGAIRLQGGTATRGRVEICNRNVWGTVCDDLWGAVDARVACRQLGFSITGAVALTLTAVPDGTGQIWLDNVQCRGTEARLIDCPANTLGSHNCVHVEDAGVSCQTGTQPAGMYNTPPHIYRLLLTLVILLIKQCAHKMLSDCKEEVITGLVVLKFVMPISGALYVTTFGITTMPLLSVDSLDSVQLVSKKTKTNKKKKLMELM